MNKHWILFHLHEAQEELTRTIDELESNPDYLETEFQIAMAHIYHHLNTGWNSRALDHERTALCSEHDFDVWRSFPTDIPLGQ